MIKAHLSLADQTLTESLRMEKQDAQEDAEDRMQENEENKKRKKRVPSYSEAVCMVEIIESRVTIISATVVGNGLLGAFSKE